VAEHSTSTGLVREDARSSEFGRHYYRHDCGIPYQRNEHWLRFFGKIADEIVRDFHPTSVLDAGCAMGFLVEALRERGVEAEGIDISDYAISQVDQSVAEHCRVASLTEPLTRRYDLIVCIEVLEHIAPAESGRAIANLCAATDRLLLSTTPDDFAEATHVNVQPPEAWSAALAGEGFLREVERDVSYVTAWAALYARSVEPLEEAVKRYDRAWWRQRREVDQMRNSLLTAHARLGELEDQPSETRPAMQVELDRRQEEIIRLRDLLIGKDAELGTAKGKLAYYEDRTERIAGAKSRIASKLPGSGPILALLLRLARGRG
jgi:2-polyprenyl-3-methyl-5-hydroxy-6-metoxy-1,4-benzoquinol methylase